MSKVTSASIAHDSRASGSRRCTSQTGVYYQNTSFGLSSFDCINKNVVGRRGHDSRVNDSLSVLGWGSLWLGLLDWLLLNWSGNWSSLNTHLSVLSSNSLLLALSVLGTTSVTLGIELSLTDLLSLELVDGLDQDVLVLELVTLGSKVELVVDVLVDLLGVSISLQKTSEDTGSADGQNLGWHTGITGTLLVTSTLMATLSLLSLVALYTGAGVHMDLSSDDKTILVELSDVLTGVGKSNLVGLIWINPDSLTSALKNGSGKSALKSEHSHFTFEVI